MGFSSVSWGLARFHGGSTRWQGSSGPCCGRRAGAADSSGRLPPRCPEEGAWRCGCRSLAPAWGPSRPYLRRFLRSNVRDTQPGGAAVSAGRRDAGPAGPRLC